MTTLIIPYDNSLHRNQVIALWDAIFAYKTPQSRSPLVIDKKLEFGDQLFFVAVIGTTVVGTVMAGYDGHRGWIYSVAVRPENRKQGIGSHLVLHAERALVDKGCLKINLQIMEGNESVAAFYTSLGYAEEKRISMGKRIAQNIPPA